MSLSPSSTGNLIFGYSISLSSFSTSSKLALKDKRMRIKKIRNAQEEEDNDETVNRY
jgi:hypothetical protein